VAKAKVEPKKVVKKVVAPKVSPKVAPKVVPKVAAKVVSPAVVKAAATPPAAVAKAEPAAKGMVVPKPAPRPVAPKLTPRPTPKPKPVPVEVVFKTQGVRLAIHGLLPMTDRPAKERGYPNGYVPTDAEKPYMNVQQLAYFRDLLLTQRAEMLVDNQQTLNDLKEFSTIESDLADQATIEYEQTLELRNRDRARKLVAKIDEALERIKAGEFGFCEETGDPIGIGRLLARPTTTLSIEAKRRQEKKEVSYVG
jgi:DnaK suppressor protein